MASIIIISSKSSILLLRLCPPFSAASLRIWAICSDTAREFGSIAVGEGVAVPLCPGLLFSPRLLPNLLRLVNPKLRVSVDPLPIRYAAVCSAVAAADLLAKWFLAFASFAAQSGLILSVVMTVDALADIEVVRLLCVWTTSAGLLVELSDDEDDIAEEKAPRLLGFAYARPRRNGGGSYVTPNSAC